MSITIKEIARLANVSHTTVSRALNDNPHISAQTKKRIKELAEKLNYMPNISARSLVLDKSFNIGLFASRDVERMPTSFIYEVLDGVNSEIENEYNIVYKILDGIDYLNQLNKGKKYDGILFLSADVKDLKLIYNLWAQKTPLVVLNRDIRNEDMPCIFADEYSGSFEATEYLIKNNHKKIAIIEGPDRFITSRQRFNGYSDALEKHNITLNKEYIIEGGFSADSGFNAMQRLLNLKDPPTAVFASNDLMAVGAINACSKCRYQVPGDMSVVGFDDTDFSRFLIPSLTTVKKSRRQLGKKGINMLMDIINGKPLKQKYEIIGTQLIIRESCRSI